MGQSAAKLEREGSTTIETVNKGVEYTRDEWKWEAPEMVKI